MTRKAVKHDIRNAQSVSQSKNILLVYPQFPLTYWGFQYAMPFVGFKAVMPPLGLITVAALLPEHYKLQLVDMNVEKLTDAHLDWADAVFTSTMVAQEPALEKVIQRAHEHGIPVVAGGPHPTTFFDTIEGVSHFVLGEMESTGTLEYFLRDFEQGQARRVYAATVKQSEVDALRSHFGDEGVILLQQDRPNISGSPVPRFDLLKKGAYQSMAIQTSRGCPVGCEFCDIWRRFGTRPRLKGAEKTLEELDELHRLGWRGSVFVVDDNFIGKKERTKNLLEHIVTWQQAHDHPFNLYTEATVNLADDPELLALMRDAGFNSVFVGIETPVAESLKEAHKLVNTKRDLHERIRTIQKAGIEVSAGFILGFDHDPEDIAQRQIDFIQGSSIPMAMVGLLTALRDTDLYERLEREGRILAASTGNNTHSFELNFVTRMPRERIVGSYKEVLHALYGPDLKNYFDRCTSLLRNLGDNPHYNRRIKVADVKGGLRSLLTQPFHRYGWEYLAFLGRTLRERPRYFPEAIRLAVMGHHFYKITEGALAVDHVQGYLAERLDHFRERMTAIRSRLSDRIEDFQHAVHDLEQERIATMRDAARKVRRISRDYQDAARVHYQHFVQMLDGLLSSQIT